MVCLYDIGICAGVSSGMHDANSVNPATIVGKVAGDAIGKMSA